MSANFEEFARLHVKGDPLVLYNCWDAGSAAAAERAGAKAVATGSAPVATALGYKDGQDVPLEVALDSARRVCAATALPVSIDFEGGYATAPDEVAANVVRLRETGAVGCNFEDQVIGGEGLHSIAFQGERIAAIRTAIGHDFFVNARTDLFLKAPRDMHDAAMLDEAIDRAKAFADAGASGFFAPGLVDLALIERLCAAVALPVNIIALPGAPDRAALAKAGVARISYGPLPYKAALAAFEDGVRAAMA
jgi:2-methylisocitrate lyase-like PEP mutase family enzyme